MIKISFLGLGSLNKTSGVYEYQATTYQFQQVSYQSNYLAGWLQKFHPEGKLYIVSTAESFAAHESRLTNLCPGFIKIIIPSGKTETEMWQIFSKLTEEINYTDGEEVIFDVTHGFRSQPILALSALIFLKSLKNIAVKHILYGAYEAKDAATNITPVYDLLPFLSIIDWAYAAQQFIQSGEMRAFTTLLSAIHNESYLNNAPIKSVELKSIGFTLSRMDDAFATLRLQEIIDYAVEFAKSATALSADFKNHIKAKPFSLLFNNVSAPLAGIAAANGSLFTPEGFAAQKGIIEFYLKSSQYQQAVTLMREFVVSCYMHQVSGLTGGALLQKSNREEAENHLGTFRRALQEKTPLDMVEEKFGEIWVTLSQRRNDIDHAGMNDKPASASKLIAGIKTLYFDKIKDL